MIIKNANKISKDFMKNTKVLISAILIMLGILCFSTTLLLFSVFNVMNIMEREEQYRNYAYYFLDSSDYLTNQAAAYVIAGSEEYYNNYINEFNNVKGREDAIFSLLDISNDDDKKTIILDTLRISDELSKIEQNAFDKVSQGDFVGAQKLMLSDEYKAEKKKMRENLKSIDANVLSKISSENKIIVTSSLLAFIITIIVSICTAISAILLLKSFFRFKAEADIDSLTGLNNRNRFKAKIQDLIDLAPDKYGALLYCDIDNLKFINECYGHINGDRYIQALAQSLKIFEQYNCVMARPSGDEIIVYIHGFNSDSEIKKAIEVNIENIKNNYFLTTMHVEEKIRFSTGVSIYNIDSTVVEELMKFSDYAMSKMKKDSKGEVGYYDKTTYDKSSFILANRGHLDDFLEKDLLEFAMQPIVDANTMEIYAYEALMRPMVDIITSPLLLLQLAKDESKLDKIERLVFKKVFEKINNNLDKLNGAKVFVNSISSQMLTNEELDTYKVKYPDIFAHLVLEITEQEYVSENMLKKKTEVFKSFGALIALDDYGAGYSNDFTILSGIYDIIKVDMKIIRDIDTDIHRQEIVKSLINISKINNYKVLAEGVETIEELKTVKKLGVHYIQGYVFGKPDLEVKGLSEEVIKMAHKL